MRLTKRRKIAEPYDIWDYTEESAGAKKKHPSVKRKLKTPLPHPGQSYNPDPEDHKKLLEKIAEKEVKYQKKLKSIEKSLRVKVKPAEVKQDEREELLSGIKHLIKEQSTNKTDKNKTNTALKSNDDDSGSETDEVYSDYDDKDFEAITKDKRVVEKRKSRKQRLGQLKDKLQRKAARLRKINNIRMSKIDGLKKINKELDEKEKELARRAPKGNRKLKNQRFGQRFEQSDPIYCLSSELPSNLRKVSCPMDSIVREQLESFQSRLMVEPTKFQVKKRKYKRPAFERKCAGDDEPIGD